MPTGTETAEEKLRRALVIIQKLQARVDHLEDAGREKVAIVGMACRFPGHVRTPDDFWRILSQGEDVVTEIPARRWDRPVDTVRYPGARWAGLLDDAVLEEFDPGFFGMSPREALSLDPRQRMLLETSHEALEDAGIAVDRLLGKSVGVFVGAYTNDYQERARTILGPNGWDLYWSTGNANNMAAGRLSFVLGVQGPALVVDTACSSSLVATHLAVRSLLDGECDLALAGGANVLLSADTMEGVSGWHACSPDGRCRTFDAAANGFVRAEGCGLVVLKRLSQAQRDGDRILAVVRGSAINHDGRSSGLTAPNVLSQQALLRKAMHAAGMAADAYDYVEAHGTGTVLGDPIELEALRAVIGIVQKDGPKCLLGSVKTNMGHAEAAAGIAGLMKIVLALQHEEIPGQVHFKSLNPLVDLSDTRFLVSAQPRPWPRAARPRRAGVSAFGFSGTNAHVIVEEAPPPPPGPADPHPLHLLVLSARTPEALQDLTNRYVDFLGDHADVAMGSVCQTAAGGRSHYAHRRAVLAGSAAQARAGLTALRTGDPAAGALVGVAAPRLQAGFLFSGQGSQYVGMGERLYAGHSGFRATLDRVAGLLDVHLPRPLLSVMFAAEPETSPLGETQYTQPALFALEYALAHLWMSWGVTPQVLLGHSIGELVAATVAGVFSLEDAARLVTARASLMQALERRGSMAAVKGRVDAVQPCLDGTQVTFAAVNGPASVVVSGDDAEVATVVERLTRDGIECRRLNVSHAFHSVMMEPMLAAFEAVAREIRYALPQLPIVSNLTGDIAGPEIATPGYWVRHVRECVRFAAGLEAVAAQAIDVLIEVGPQATLLGLVPANLAERSPLCLPSLRPGKDWEMLLGSLGQLYTRGLPIDWAAYDGPCRHPRVALPTYPFQRKRYWTDVTVRHDAPHPWLGEAVEGGFATTVSCERFRYLGDHRVRGRIVVPAAAWLEAAMAAATATFGTGRHQVSSLALLQPLVLEDDETIVLQAALTHAHADRVEWTVRSRSQEDSTGSGGLVHATATLQRGPGSLDPEALPTGAERAPLNVDTLYDTLRRAGIEHGPAFRGVVGLARSGDVVVADLELPAGLDASPYRMHPALLDAVLQVGTATWSQTPDGESGLPFAVARFVCAEAVPTRLKVHAAVREATGQGLTVDFHVTDVQGAVVARVEGHQARLVSPAVMHRALRGSERHWTFRLGWQPAAAVTSPPSGSCRILGDGHGVGERLGARLQALGMAVVHHAGDDWATAWDASPGSGEGPVQVVVLWPQDDVGPDAERQRRLFTRLLALGTRLAAAKHPVRLRLVTRSAQSRDGEDVDVGQAPVWGWGRSVAEEQPPWHTRLIDLPAGHDDDLDALATEVLCDDAEGQTLWRDGQRWTARLEPAAVTGSECPIRNDAAYLVTGGLGALGRVLTEWLVGRGAGQVVLLARSAPTGEAQAWLERLSARGARIDVAVADVADGEALARICDAPPGGAPLRGVLHAAGRVDDGLLAHQTWERYAAVLAPKVEGAWGLHQATRTLTLDFFVLFSSTASVFGGIGQSAYAAGNAFLDGVAAHRRAHGLPALSIDWGAWAVGMFERLSAPQQQRLRQQGVRPLAVTAGVRLLEDLLSESGQVVVARLHLQDHWAHFSVTHRRLLSRLAPQAAPAGLPTNGHRTRPSVIDTVRTLVARTVSIEAGSLDVRQLFRELGFDSLMAVELCDNLNLHLGLALPATSIFEHPTVEALAAYIESVDPGPSDTDHGTGPTLGPDDVRRLATSEVARVLGLDPASVPVDVPLRELGMDSLMAVELSTGLGARLGQAVPGTLALEYPTLDAMIAYLATLVPQHGDPAPAAAPRSGDLLATVRQCVGRVVDLPAPDVDLDATFRDLGFDSLMAVELVDALNAALGQSLPATLVFERPSARQVVEHLTSVLSSQPTQVSEQVQRIIPGHERMK